MSNSFNMEWDQLKSEWEALGVEQGVTSLGYGDVDEQVELTGYELIEETEQLRAEWAAMSVKRQAKAWDRFTRDIDEGVAGWNRFHPILWPAYEVGASIL